MSVILDISYATLDFATAMIEKVKLKSNREFWIEKIERNIKRDSETDRTLYGMGWIVMRFWGSDIKKNLSGCVEDVMDTIFQSRIEAYISDFEYCEQ